jgi:hypothetical protein
MWGLNKEILKAFTPYIRAYCNGEITNDKFNNILDEIEELENVITEGDGRYICILNDSLPLFFMLKNNAIKVIKKKIISTSPLLEETRVKLNKSSWSNVQSKGKTIFTKILENAEYKEIEYEKNCYNIGRCDVYGINRKSKIEIIGECGPCRLDKIINTLKFDNLELWHLNNDSELFIYKRDSKWSEMYRILEKAQHESIFSLFEKDRQRTILSNLMKRGVEFLNPDAYKIEEDEKYYIISLKNKPIIKIEIKGSERIV